jgi:AhpC/TSA family
MNRDVRSSFVAVLLLISSAYAAKVGESAPDFQATASNGQVYKLSQYRGQFVVLEWHNNGCPYTRKHYESGNMQRLQRDWTRKGSQSFPPRRASKGMLPRNRKMTTSSRRRLRPRQHYWIRRVMWEGFTPPRPLLICLLLILKVCWSTTALSIAKRPRTKPISQLPRTTFPRHWRKQWETSQSASRPVVPMAVRSSTPTEGSGDGSGGSPLRSSTGTGLAVFFGDGFSGASSECATILSTIYWTLAR